MIAFDYTEYPAIDETFVRELAAWFLELPKGALADDAQLAEFELLARSIVAENRACAIEDVQDVDVIAGAMFAQRMEG